MTALDWLRVSGLYTTALDLTDLEYRESKNILIDSAWNHLYRNFYRAMYCQFIGMILLGVKT